ncbi:hypothetical protein [Acinetobacter sp. CFCC 11171]|uniref:hypothetical protein n=1 Tax=Acinetobacter sp. CFCC 11171 TaxID=1775558 RepID=UPI000DD06C5F|nr:hypothetical protein [Acinetobacter sp. CFCC 11171]
MLKLIIGTFSTLFVLCTAFVIFYWRDTGYDPTAFDLVTYFLLLPLALCAIILSPYLLYKGIQHQKEKKLEAEKRAEEQAEQQQLEAIEQAKPKPIDVQQFRLNVYSSAAWHSFGENEQIIQDIQQFKSPELDDKLFNAYGLPVLSFRIKDLDELTNEEADDEYSAITMREKRIQSLIQQQLEQHVESLFLIAEHLKQSALFYDSELAYQYRMHPGWVDPDYTQDEHPEHLANNEQQVSRLNRLNVHILLADNLIHQWNDDYAQIIQQYLSDGFSIIPEQIHIEPHFIGTQVAYSEWLSILEMISKQKFEVSLILNADSEIDQEWIDEKMWLQEKYIAAEFASSWCLAASEVQVRGLTPNKVLQVVAHEPELKRNLELKALNNLDQYDQEQPFLLMLDDATDMKVVKKLQHKFNETAIETYHFLYTKQNLGNTQQLAKIFGFMLGMHLPEELTAMIYSTDQESTFAFIQAFSVEDELEQETV